jgi:hypothetical protein
MYLFKLGAGVFELCSKVKTIMNKFGFPWFIAGGWAIDLFLNRETRVHDDIEIGIYRRNQMHLYRYFDKYKKYYINNRSRIGIHERLEWNKEYLRLPIHELYVEYAGLEIEVLLNERDDNKWIYRRNDQITLDEKKVICFNEDRIPYLCPEIVLLYKTKEMRNKDIDDITNAIGKMDESQKKWFIDSIGDEKIKERIRNLTTAST